VQDHPFATLITPGEPEPVVTHLPLLLVADCEPHGTLFGHFARANPHASSNATCPSVAIFHGPHAYISPALYEIRESVPTWNYATVHAYGRGKILPADTDKHQVLAELISQFDSAYLDQWKSFDEPYRVRMLTHIVAFEIAVTRLETKFKLSQNRTKAEQENVIQALGGSPDPAVSGLAELMRERGLGLK